MSQTNDPITPRRKLPPVASDTDTSARGSDAASFNRWPPASGSTGVNASSVLAEVLREKCRYGTHHSGASGQFARKDAAGFHRRPESASLDLRPERLEQGVSRMRHAAGNLHHLGIEHIEQVRHPCAEEACGVTHDLHRHSISAAGRLVHGLRRYALHVKVGERRKNARVAGFERLTSTSCDGRSRRIRFQAAIVAALAASSVGINGGVSNLSGNVRSTVVQLSVQDEASADAGADRHTHYMSASTRGTTQPLT